MPKRVAAAPLSFDFTIAIALVSIRGDCTVKTEIFNIFDRLTIDLCAILISASASFAVRENCHQPGPYLTR